MTLHKSYKVISIVCISLFLISACGITPNAYVDNKPEFKFNQFFNGRLCAWGVVKDRKGELTRKFIAKIDAINSNNTTQLNEVFLFNDNEVQYRHWRFSLKNEQLIGTAEDVIGNAVGKVWGDSLHLTYVLEVKTDDDTWQVNMDDWLHLVDKNTLMGTTQMSKWGVNLGRIDIAIQQRVNTDDCGINQSQTETFNKG